MSQQKSKRLVVEAVKKFCKENDYEWLKYEHGKCAHDKVYIKVWGIVVNVGVSGTPSNGAQAAAKRAVHGLKTKIIRLQQQIIEGNIDVSKNKRR